MQPHNDTIFDKSHPTLPPRYSYDPQRRHSIQTREPRRPVSFSLTSPRSSRNELNDRIADSFKEFSAMLQQLSPPTVEPVARRPSAPNPTLTRTETVPLPPSPPPQSNKKRPKKLIRTTEKRWSAASLPSVSTEAPFTPPISTPSTMSSMTFTLPPTMMDAEVQEEDNKALLLESCASILKAAATQQQQPQRRRQVLRLLISAASDGNMDSLKAILKEPWVPVDVSIDEVGWTPLIYTACYGHIDSARALLEAGATIDYQDKKGWTALSWAASRRDEAMVRFLIDQGASCEIPSLAGYTLYRDTGLRHLLPRQLQHLGSDNRHFPQRRKSQPVSRAESLMYYSADMYSYTNIIKDDDDDDDVFSTTVDEDIVAWEQTIQSFYRFDWDQCRPDQMFVFGQDNVAHIVDTLVDIKLPLASYDDVWVPANILFLSCRFAHYHSRRELGQELLTTAIARIAKTIKANARTIHHLSFWITNLYQLLIYFKRDTHLAATTTAADHRLMKSLLAETFDIHLVSYAERQMEKLVEPSMLEFCEESDGIFATPVAFVEDRSWQQRMMGSSFRRNSSTTVTSPTTLINTMTTMIDTLIAYRVHPSIVHQFTQSCLAFCSAAIFDSILANKKYLSRSKAILIRMNVSSLEEWARTQDQQPLLLFRPVVQLLQFLQSVSHLHDFNVFQDTIRQLDCLTPTQVRHIVSSYRYEVGEPQLPATTGLRVSEDSLSTSAQQEPARPVYPFVVPPIDLVITSKSHTPYPTIPEQWVVRLDHRK